MYNQKISNFREKWYIKDPDTLVLMKNKPNGRKVFRFSRNGVNIGDVDISREQYRKFKDGGEILINETAFTE